MREGARMAAHRRPSSMPRPWGFGNRGEMGHTVVGVRLGGRVERRGGIVGGWLGVWVVANFPDSTRKQGDLHVQCPRQQKQSWVQQGA